MKKLVVLLFLLGVMSYGTRGQSTTLTQTSGQGCTVAGCINTKLSDSETFTFSDTLKYYGSYNILGKLQFRGMHYDLVGQSSGYQIIDLSGANGQFAVHEAFAPNHYGANWQNGHLSVANEYVGADPGYYGSTGYPSYNNITTGTGQVGVVTAAPFDQVVTLVSGDPSQIQLPSQVTILAGALDASFTITASAKTQPTSPPQLPPQTVTIMATFPDGHSTVDTVTVEPLPAPPPSSGGLL